MAEQLKQYEAYRKDPVNNPRPESLVDEDYFKDQMGNQESPPVGSANLPPVPHRSKPKSILTCSDSVNGKVMEKYAWSQQLDELVIRVPLPAEIVKGSQVHVKYTKRQIGIWWKEESEEGGLNVVLNTYLMHAIDVSESDWTLVPGEAINITLGKLEPK